MIIDYDELMASHAAVGETPDNPDSPEGSEPLSYRQLKSIFYNCIGHWLLQNGKGSYFLYSFLMIFNFIFVISHIFNIMISTAKYLCCRPKKKKKSALENGEGSSGVQANEIEIVFKHHTALPYSLGQWIDFSLINHLGRYVCM